jgi:RNA polymerase sigma-70 factor (ECF subfamily)
MKVVSDKDILTALKRNDPKAIQSVIELYGNNMMRRALAYLRDKELAEDICQEVYYSLWKKRGEIRISSSLAGYLSTMVKNKCLNYLKSNSKIIKEDISALEFKKSAYSDSHSLLEASEMSDRLSDYIAQLPEQCRIVFEMSRFDHLTNAEIANRLGKSVKTVENQMSRALKELKEKFSKAYPHLNLIKSNVALVTFVLLGLGDIVNNSVL